MNHHKFDYLDPAGRRKPHLAASLTVPQGAGAVYTNQNNSNNRDGSNSGGRFPIRVTPSALSWLLHAILYSVEFHAPAEPRLWQLAGGSPAPHGKSERASSTTATGAAAGEGTAGTDDTSIVSAAAVATGAAALVGSVVSSFFKWGGNVVQSVSTGTTATPATTQEAPVTASGCDAAFVSPQHAQPQRRQQNTREAALKESQLTQPCVTPVIQQLSRLGGAYIVVCQSHNKTIEPACRYAMERINTLWRERREANHRKAAALVALQQQQRQQLQQQLQQQQQGIPPALAPLPGTPHPGASFLFGDGESAAQAARRFSSSPVTTTAGSFHGSQSSNSSPLPGSLSQLLNRPIASTSTSTAAAERPPPPPFGLLPGEFGLELSVRLLCQHQSTWRSPQRRVLAELTFPIVRTADESSVVTYDAADDAGEVGGRSPSQADPPATPPDAAAAKTVDAVPLIFTNDAKQVEDVVGFISESFYKAISLDTFADFTAGELVFDLQVKEKRAFAAPRPAL